MEDMGSNTLPGPDTGRPPGVLELGLRGRLAAVGLWKSPAMSMVPILPGDMENPLPILPIIWLLLVFPAAAIVGPGKRVPMGAMSVGVLAQLPCRGEAPGKRGTSGPLGVVGPLHMLGVLGDGTGNLPSMEGVLGPPWLVAVLVVVVGVVAVLLLAVVVGVVAVLLLLLLLLLLVGVVVVEGCTGPCGEGPVYRCCCCVPLLSEGPCGVWGAEGTAIPGEGTGKRSGVLGPVNLGWGSEEGVSGVVGPPKGVAGPERRLPSPTLSPILKISKYNESFAIWL